MQQLMKHNVQMRVRKMRQRVLYVVSQGTQIWPWCHSHALLSLAVLMLNIRMAASTARHGTAHVRTGTVPKQRIALLTKRHIVRSAMLAITKKRPLALGTPVCAKMDKERCFKPVPSTKQKNAQLAILVTCLMPRRSAAKHANAFV
jgi:hypothetical protein